MLAYERSVVTTALKHVHLQPRSPLHYTDRARVRDMEEIAPREKSITRDAAAADASARAVLDDMAVSGAPIYRATGIYNVAPEWRKSQRSHLLVAFLSFVQSSVLHIIQAPGIVDSHEELTSFLDHDPSLKYVPPAERFDNYLQEESFSSRRTKALARAREAGKAMQKGRAGRGVLIPSRDPRFDEYSPYADPLPGLVCVWQRRVTR